MSKQALQFLNEMKISNWQIRQPEYFSHLKGAQLSLPEQCRLLFVAPEKPIDDDAFLFGKVLASMKLSSEQALFLSCDAFPFLAEHHLQWCWFSGTAPIEIEGVQLLHSPPLKEMHHNAQLRRDLWKQICAYER